jgi:NADH-quinone oxidoreductase subunit E
MTQGTDTRTIEISREKLAEYVAQFREERGAIIAILNDIQDTYDYLPEPVLLALSEALEMPLSELYGLATFYRAFSMKPKGKHRLCVCMGTACHVRGARTVLEQFERLLGVKAGETTEDGLFTVETVNCVGSCAIGPVVLADGQDYHGMLDASKVAGVIEHYRAKERR